MKRTFLFFGLFYITVLVFAIRDQLGSIALAEEERGVLRDIISKSPKKIDFKLKKEEMLEKVKDISTLDN